MPAVEDSKKLFGWDVKGVSFISTTPKRYWLAQTCKNSYALMILFWKLHNIAHTDHIWFTTPNIVNGTILFHTFHMDMKGGNWLCLNHFLRAHFPLTSQKGGIFRGGSKGEKILHSKHLICHDRVSSVKWQIDNLSIRDMASLELANKGSRGGVLPYIGYIGICKISKT